MARIIGLLLLGAALAGCSSIRLGYNNLPTLSYWWLDGYVDFDSAQAPRVRTALAQLLDWHRQNELPKFAALLEDAEQLAPTDITPEAVCRIGDDVRQRVLTVARQAEAPGAALALSLTEPQLAHLQRKYAKVNADFRKEWLDLSPAQQQTKRHEKLLERYEDFYGALDARQRQLLRSLTANSVFDAGRQHAEQQRRQQKALEVLQRLRAEGATPRQAEAAVRSYVLEIANPPAGPWRTYQAALREEGCAQLATVHGATTATQRARAVERLRAYRRDVEALAAPG